jgi:hypothetical protein
MLEHFFGESKEENTKVFSKLKFNPTIYPELFERFCGKYFVFRFTFRDMAREDFYADSKDIGKSCFLRAFHESIRDIALKVIRILDKLPEETKAKDRTTFNDRYNSVDLYRRTDDNGELRQLNGETLARFLERICLAIREYFGKNKCVVLIDEYDTPLEAIKDADKAKLVTFLSTFFGVLKNEEGFLDFLIVTGITRISGQKILSPIMSNSDQVDITNKKLSEYIGFTDDEVLNLIERSGLANTAFPECGSDATRLLRDRIKEQYGGYLFGKTFVYNPYSVMYCLDDLFLNSQEIDHLHRG